MKKRCKKYDKNLVINTIKNKLCEYSKETKKIIDENYGISELKVFYHYSPLDNFKNIINSKEIWYTHYKDLSDENELKYPYEISKEVIKEVVSKSPYKEFWRNFCSVFYADGFFDQFAVYIFSCSAEKDNSDLWTNFSNNHNGCAIGFDQYYFKGSEKKIVKNTSQDLFEIIIRINNDQEKFKNYIREFASLVESKLHETISKDFIKLTSSVSREFQLDLQIALMSNILTLLPGLTIFQNEKEIRRFIIEFQVGGKFYPCRIPENRKRCVEGKKIVASDLDLGYISQIIIGKNVDEKSYKNIKSYGEANKIETVLSKCC
jgi:hypothetical protein